MKITEFNFIGDYKAKTPSGKFVQYNKGDVVHFNDETFIAMKRIVDSSPILGEDVGWFPLAKHQILYELATAPFYPKVGDEWLDTTTGVMYKRIKNKNSETWVEL